MEPNGPRKVCYCCSLVVFYRCRCSKCWLREPSLPAQWPIRPSASSRGSSGPPASRVEWLSFQRNILVSILNYVKCLQSQWITVRLLPPGMATRKAKSLSHPLKWCADAGATVPFGKILCSIKISRVFPETSIEASSPSAKPVPLVQLLLLFRLPDPCPRSSAHKVCIFKITSFYWISC